MSKSTLPLARAYVYTRVSTTKQDKSGLSLKAQEHRCRDYYRLRLKREATWGGIFVERGVSAFRLAFHKRKCGAALEAQLKRGDHLVFAKLDRAFRSLRDFADSLARWHKRGVYVHLLDLGVDTTTPGGKLVASIMAAIAEWESQRIGERIRDAHAERRRQGRATNGTQPIGYRKTRGKRILPNAKERQIARYVLKLRRLGFEWEAITERLNKEHVQLRKLSPRRQRKGQGRRWTKDAAMRWAVAAELKFPWGVRTRALRASR